jgi:hypothetical protein
MVEQRLSAAVVQRVMLGLDQLLLRRREHGVSSFPDAGSLTATARASVRLSMV